MKSLLAYRFFTLRSRRDLWGSLLLTILLSLALGRLALTGGMEAQGQNFWTARLPAVQKEEALWAYALSGELLSQGGGACLLGAVIGAMTICRELRPQALLPVRSAGHGRRRVIAAEALVGLSLGAVSLLALTGLTLLAQRDQTALLFAWSPGYAAAMVGLSLTFRMGNLALFLLLSLVLCRRELVLLVAMALTAMEVLSTGPNFMALLPTGGMAGLLTGTASVGQLLLGLGETAGLIALCFLVPKKWVFRW